MFEDGVDTGAVLVTGVSGRGAGVGSVTEALHVTVVAPTFSVKDAVQP
jgi:hypothetical protein